jgi:hypothetical protein
MKFTMAATAGLSLTFDPMGKMFQNAFVVSEKKAFEHFPIGSNVNLCIVVAAILDFRSTSKHILEDLPMIIPGQFGFNCPSGFREEAF